jgi:hypothetical protein
MPLTMHACILCSSPRDMLHHWLVTFGSSTSGGLTLDAYEQLKDSISALPDDTPTRTLLQAAEAAGDSDMLAVEPWRQITHSLGSTAPADQLLPVVLCGIIDALLAGSMAAHTCAC